MSLSLWLSFVGASCVLLLIPGPTVLQCIGDALANRRQQSWSTVLGVGVGDAVAMTLSLLGAGALLKTSAAAFTVMKTVGGMYLIYLGVRAMWSARAAGETQVPVGREESALMRFSKASTITMLNPKSILFFVAFVPQFLSPKAPFFGQSVVLLATFVVLGMLNAWVYMALAGVLGRRLESRAAQRRVGYASGGVLLTAGVLTLGLKRR